MIDTTIIASIISVIGGAIITLLSLFFGGELASFSFRKRHKTPDIIGKWKNKWYINDKLYTEDTVEIKKWLKKNRFLGVGHDPKGNYIIRGEIDSSRILLGIYKEVTYPTKGYVGVVLLKLSINSNIMEGYWNGRSAKGKLVSGKTKWERI